MPDPREAAIKAAGIDLEGVSLGATSRTPQAEGNLAPDSLIGSFFYSDQARGWQGLVVAEVHPSVYLVQLYSWLDGGCTNQRLIRLDDMIDSGWMFYESAEEMHHAYETGRIYTTGWKHPKSEKGGS